MRVAAIATILGVDLAISAAVLGAGFVAVSDDDFSRVVIAQSFVAHPSLDPSNSSWLPLPFVLLGTFMSLFGRSLAVARVVAVAESVAALLLVYRAAKNLEFSDRAAIAGAVLAAALPTAARLDVSFQPEALTAGLVLFGASTLSRAGRERVLGGLALGAATLCRYEAWPAALVFAVLCARDVVRDRRAAAAALAVIPACTWMIHGALSHGSPVFFFQRVSSYRQAFGETEPKLVSLFAYAAALFRSEPELVFAGAALLALAVRARDGRLARFARLSSVLGAVLLFLVAGRLIGGAPTHHDERPLLPIFWALAMFVACRALDADLGRSSLAVVLGAAACGSFFRFTRPSEPFAGRAAEVAIGGEARRRMDAGDRLLVETGDYGYFAVMAAFGAPERAEPFDRRDPRDQPAPDAFASPTALRSRLAARGATWFVAPQGKRAIAENGVGTAATQNDAFVLFRTETATGHR